MVAGAVLLPVMKDSVTWWEWNEEVYKQFLQDSLERKCGDRRGVKGWI